MTTISVRSTIKRITRMITDGGIILTLYVLILVAALSFYAPTGYYMLGEHKALCFLTVSAVFFVLLLPAVISHIILFIKECNERGMAVYDILPIIALIALTVSHFLSSDHSMSLWGIDGWRMGYVTYLFIFYAYMACRLIDIGKYLRLTASFCESVSALVFTLGILNRMGVYPFASMISTDTSFISTIGNINWYSAYIAVFLSLGICDIAFFIPSFKEAKGISYIIKSIIAWICVLTGYFTLISMGGTVSVIMIFVIFATLTSALILKHIKPVLFFYLLISFFIILEIYGFILKRPTSTYTYSTDAVWLTPAMSHIGAYACIILIVSYLLYIKAAPGKAYRISAFCIWLMIPLSAAACLILIALYACPVIINDSFANSRGLIYRISGLYIRQLSPLRILFGVGPDSFYVYASKDSLLSSLLWGNFGDIRLTNAHCLPLSCLINNGLLYTICMIFFFIMIIRSFVKKIFFSNKNGSVTGPAFKSSISDDKRTALAYVGLMIISSVLFVQFFTFATVTATPFLFMAAGICLSEDLINRSDYTE